MNQEMSTTMQYYKLLSTHSSIPSVHGLEELGVDGTEAHELDSKHKCIVNNLYFRAWQWHPPQCAKMTIWCLAQDGSVLKTQEPFLVRDSVPEKSKAPMTLFVDERVIQPGMSTEQIKQARLQGVKLWNALSPEDKTFWKEKALEANTRSQQHLAFKLVMTFSECKLRPVIKMLRDLDKVHFSNCCGDRLGEPVVISTLRRILQLGFLESPFRSNSECMCEYWDAMNVDFGTSIEEYKQCLACHDIGQNIFHVEFAHQLVMASTMLRLQERYECPNAELRGRCFSLSEYKAWERQHDPAHGFRYYEQWPGFNVPGSIVRAALQEDSLLPREQALKQVLGDILFLPNFYIIGTRTCDASSSLYHEVCHAMFEVNKAYRFDVDAELDTIAEGPMRRMKAYLRCEQYANVERILQDEVHAYLSEGDKLGCKSSETAPHTKRLQRIFLKHAGDLAYLLDDLCESDFSTDDK